MQCYNLGFFPESFYFLQTNLTKSPIDLFSIKLKIYSLNLTVNDLKHHQILNSF